ncbi:hypothetical protein PVAND_010596 [Polypedilum vanderplanki]|uniref:Uncharacterized protein n=1 Tax=Polypedilum vanderplanki TaxID=319348 RepID=A0A9J6CH22_POLVA|nr:hypothetical protein PVAND_010596 [Polypedilum vanderplanki]
MSDREKYLRPIREYLLNLHLKDSVEKLKQYAEKDKFYESCMISILIDIIESKKEQKNEIIIDNAFDIFNFIMKKGVCTTALLIHIYNYSLREKDMSSYIAKQLLKLCQSDVHMDAKGIESYILLNYQLSRIKSIYTIESNRYIIYENICKIMKYVKDNEFLQEKLFRTFDHSIRSCVYDDKNHSRVNEFIKEVIIKGLNQTKIKLTSAAAFRSYLNMFLIISDRNDIDSSFERGILGLLIKAVDNVLTNEEEKTCNNILMACNNLAEKSIVEMSALKEFHQKFYKDVSTTMSQNELHQKTLMIIMKILFLKHEKFEPSAECFSFFHDLVFSFLHILKNIKSESNVISCCTDIKRHEIFKLIRTTINYLIQVATCNTISLKYPKYYLKYALQICDEIKCDSKDVMLRQTFDIVYNFLFEFYQLKSSCLSKLEIINYLYKQALQICQKEIKSFGKERINNLTIIGSAIFEPISQEENQDIARQISKGFASVYVLQKQMMNEATDDKIMTWQKALWKTLFHMRNTAKTLGYKNATKLLEKCFTQPEIKDLSKDIKFDDVLVQEYISLSRYSPQSVEERCELFKNICDTLTDMTLFAHACNAVADVILKNIDRKKFEDLNDRLEKEMSKQSLSDYDVKKLLALIFNNYFLFYIAENEIVANIQEKSPKNDNDNDFYDCYNLKTELKLLNYLNKSLLYCDKLHSCLEKDKRQIDQIDSKRQFFIIIENLSVQYSVRGVEFKDIEAKTFLWKFLLCNVEQQQENIIETATYFLDNYNKLIDNSGNYIRISKSMSPVRIEEVLLESNKAMEKLVEKFDKHSDGTQARIFNYFLSLWQFYMIKGKRDDGQKVWLRYEKLRGISKIQENPNIDLTIQAKADFLLAELSLQICRKNAADLVNEAVNKIHNVHVVNSDLMNIFNQILRNILTKTLQFSVNRLLDMDHYVMSIKFLKDRSIRKGHFIKTLEYTSLMVLWRLNMENVEEAKNELEGLTSLLQIKDQISVNVPIKKQIALENVNISPIVSIRDASMLPKHKIEFNADTWNENEDNISQQLLQLIHDRSCKCSMCQYPLIKCMLFQVGCHYSRLYWLLGKFDITKEFYENALDPWRYFYGKLMRSNSKYSELLSINKMEFVKSSIQWLFQAADTYIRAGNYEEAEEIYTEVDILCTNKMFDSECIKQGLYARKENLQLLIQQREETKEKSENEMSFEEFCKVKGIKSSPTVDDIKEKKTSAVKKTDSKKEKSQKDLTKKLTPSSLVKVTASSSVKLGTSSSSSSINTVKTNLAKTSKDIKSEDIIYIDSEEESIIQNEDPPKIKRKDKLQTPATMKVTRKANEKSVKKKVEDVVDLTRDTPVTRVRRRMI